MHVIGTAGHVDHGKSTLVEYLTGTDPDRLAEEKRRGLTIDLGFAWLALPSGREIGIIDVPGHERFIKNMLAGAGGISVCLFVVAANEGLMPQSIEHLAILDLLGISKGVVALTKSDTVDAATQELAAAEVSEHLAKTSLAGIPIVACSAVTGEGIGDLLAALDEAVGSAPPIEDRGRPRMWIDRVFTIAGAGTVVTGTLTGGALGAGALVDIAPAGRRTRVRSLQSHNREVATIRPGNRTALNLAGLERNGAERGDAVVAPGRWRATRLADARIEVLAEAVAGRGHELSDRGAHLLYVGSAETPVRIKLLGRDRLRAGETGFAQLRLRDPLPLYRGDRFVLRDAGRVLTFGGGQILDPLPRPARRADRGRAELLERLSGGDERAALAALLEAEDSLDVEDALFRSGSSDAGPHPQLGSMLVSSQRMAELSERTAAALRHHHAAHPLERGMGRELLRAELGLSSDSFDVLVSALPEVVEEGATVRLAGFSVSLDGEQRKAADQLIAIIEKDGFTPPLRKDLAVDEALLRSLEASRELVRVGDFYLSARQAEHARTRVRAHIASEGPATIAAIRDLLGTSRKYAVPLSEWLDATGATRRQGDVRVLGPSA